MQLAEPLFEIVSPAGQFDVDTDPLPSVWSPVRETRADSGRVE